MPIAIGIALFITFYAPRRIASALGYLVDLLAAVPSVVFGLWGLFFLAPNLVEVNQFLSHWLGWTVIFNYRQDSIPANRSDFTAGLVLAIMILPIVSAIAREIFRQVPTTHIEGALALGATRWEMIRLSVLPFGRAGLVSAAMLGLGRALGETLAVATILSAAYNPEHPHPGGRRHHVRVEHRLEIQRSRRRGHRCVDRVRPLPVRDHPAGQLGVAADPAPAAEGLNP